MQQSSAFRSFGFGRGRAGGKNGGSGNGLLWFSKSKGQPQTQNMNSVLPGAGAGGASMVPPSHAQSQPPHSFPPLPAEPEPLRNGISGEDALDPELDLDPEAEEESEYEEIDHLPQVYANGNGDASVTRPAGIKWICSLCGSSAAVRCQMCNNQLFCGACNEMYHRHPQRHCHVRKLLEVVHTRPPLPPKAFLQQQQQQSQGQPPVPAHMSQRGTIVSRSPSPHHFSTQYLNEEGLPVAPPRRNRKFGSTSNLRSTNNSPTLTRKFSFGLDPFGSLKRLFKGNSEANANIQAAPVKPVAKATAAPINRIAEIPTLHNAWKQDINARRQQKQFQQILSNAAHASRSMQRLNESDEFELDHHRTGGTGIPTTVLEFGNRGNSRSFANLNDPHQVNSVRDVHGGPRHWVDEDNEVRHINRNNTMMHDGYSRSQRSQANEFNHHSTSATNLHRISTAHPATHFGTMQRPTRNSISGPAPAPASVKPPLRPPPSVPPKQFYDPRQTQMQQQMQMQHANSFNDPYLMELRQEAQNRSRYPQGQMFQSAYELNRADAGAFVPWVRPSGFQDFHEQQRQTQITGRQRPSLQDVASWGNTGGPASLEHPVSDLDLDLRRGSEPVFRQPQEPVYRNDQEKYGNTFRHDEKPVPLQEQPRRPIIRAQSQIPMSAPPPQPKPKPSAPAPVSPPKKEPEMAQQSRTPSRAKQFEYKQPEPEPEKVTTTFKITETPEGPWSCEHCTFVNPKSTKVCTICCKTPMEGYRTICNSNDANAKSISKSVAPPPPDTKTGSEGKPKKKLARSPPPPPAEPSSSESEQSEEESESDSEGSSSGNENVITIAQRQKVSPPKKAHAPAQVNNANKGYVRQNSRELKNKKTPAPAAQTKATGSGPTRNTNVGSKLAAFEQKVNSGPKNANLKASNLKRTAVVCGDKPSKGTSPPPQEISTQTYEALPSATVTTTKPRPGSALKSDQTTRAYQSDAAVQSQSTSSSREESPPPQSRIALSDKAMRYARRAQQQAKLKRSASAHLTSAEIDEPWAFNEFHHHPNYHRRFHNQGGHHQPEYDGRNMYRSSSRHSLASDTRSLPVSGPPSRDTSPTRRYYDDFRGSGAILKASWDRFPSPGDYFASIEDLVARKHHESMKSQEFELSRLLKDAEELNYSPEDVQVALKMCGDRNPLKWLQENWSSMIETVQTLATKYGREKGQELNDVGTISSSEAKDALRHHRGNVWAAVTECVEQRRRKFSELQSRGTFLREDILTALTAHHGNIDAAYVELSKAQLKPFLMRIWGPPSGQDNEASAPRTDSVLSLFNLDLIEQKQMQTQASQSQAQNQNAIPFAVASELNQAQAPKLPLAAAEVHAGANVSTLVQQQQQQHGPVIAQNASVSAEVVQGRANEGLPAVAAAVAVVSQVHSQSESQLETLTGKGLETQVTFNEKASSANTAVTATKTKSKPVIKPSTRASEPNTNTGNAKDANVVMPVVAPLVSKASDENHVKYDPEDENFVDASSDYNIISERGLGHEPERKESLISNNSYSSRGSNSNSTSFSTSTSSSNPDLLLDESHISHFIQNFLVPEPPPYEHIDTIPATAKDTITLPEALSTLRVISSASSTSQIFQEGLHANKENEIEFEHGRASGAEATLSVSVCASSPQSSMSLPSPCCSSSMSFGDDGTGTVTGGGGDGHSRTSSELEKLFGDSHQQMVSPQSQLANLAKAMNIITAKLGVLLVKQDAEDEANSTATANIASALINMTPTSSEQKSYEISEEPALPSMPVQVPALEFQVQQPQPQTQAPATTKEVPSSKQVPLESLMRRIPDMEADALVIMPPDEFNDDARPHLNKVENANSTISSFAELDPVLTYAQDSSQQPVENTVALGQMPVHELTAAIHLAQSEVASSDLNAASVGPGAIITSQHQAPLSNASGIPPDASGTELNEGLQQYEGHATGKTVTHTSQINEPTHETRPHEMQSAIENKIQSDNKLVESAEVRAVDDKGAPVPVGSLKTQNEGPMNTEDAPSVYQQVSTPDSEVSSDQNHDHVDGEDILEDQLEQEEHEQEEPELNFEGDEDEEGDGELDGSGESGSFSLSDGDGESHEYGSEGGSFDEGQEQDEGEGEQNEEHEDRYEDEEALVEENLVDSEEIIEDNDDDDHDEREMNLEYADDEENIYEEVQVQSDHVTDEIDAETHIVMDAGLLNIVQVVNHKSGGEPNEKVKAMARSRRNKHARLSPRESQALTLTPTQQVVKKIPRNAITAMAQSLSSPTVATALTSNEKSLTEIKINQYISTGKVRTVNQAQLALKLIDMNFIEDDSLAAATECSSLYTALCFLQQECLLCAGKFCAKQMISMLHCVHRCCRTCAAEYFMVQIRDHPIIDLTCPFCKEPSNLSDDPEFTATTDYFSQLDIVLKNILSERYHEMFQRKLRDWTLAKMPNFKWCSKCSSGFIMEPMQTRLVCPDCSAVTCAICLEEWDKDNHDHKDRRRGESIDLCDESDPDCVPPLKSIVNFLNENCIQCPNCKQRFTLARGGCMHLTCSQCRFEFCSGCSSQFRMGSKCSENAFCQKLGLHSHHPRNCLFYLRDKEPEMLRKLLDENKIPYNKEELNSGTGQNTENSSQAQSPDSEGSKSRTRFKCQVPIQKETEDGAQDDICGQETCPGHTTVCLVHYVEYLGLLIWQNGLDPISLLNNDDLETIIKRAHKRLPRKPYGTTDAEYRPSLLKVIEVEIPLQPQPH